MRVVVFNIMGKEVAFPLDKLSIKNMRIFAEFYGNFEYKEIEEEKKNGN